MADNLDVDVAGHYAHDLYAGLCVRIYAYIRVYVHVCLALSVQTRAGRGQVLSPNVWAMSKLMPAYARQWAPIGDNPH